MTLSYLRPWNIAARTAHIGVIGALFGGHVYGIGPERLVPWLYASIATGIALVVLEAWPGWRWCLQARGIMTIAKVLLLCLVPWVWDYRVAVLVAAIVLGSVGSHMPKRLRNYSIAGDRFADEKDKADVESEDLQ